MRLEIIICIVVIYLGKGEMSLSMRGKWKEKGEGNREYIIGEECERMRWGGYLVIYIGKLRVMRMVGEDKKGMGNEWTKNLQRKPTPQYLNFVSTPLYYLAFYT